MKTYYIYHVPGVKIGCSTEPEKRTIAQGFTNYEILEEHNDIYLASNREIELQKQYGYRVDTSPYYISVKNRPVWNCVPTKECTILGGIVTGRKNVESGHLDRVRDIKKATEASRRRITCQHCNKDANTGNYSRWHGDNCKHKKRYLN